MLKELILLIKLLFKKVDSNKTELPILMLKHFPFKGYRAMMWCGYIIDNENDKYNITERTKQHEMVHYQQMCSLNSYVKYYLIYLWEWIKNGMFGSASYHCNPMEIEAYVNEIHNNYKTYKGKYKKYKLKNHRKIYKQNRLRWKTFIRNYFKDVH